VDRDRLKELAGDERFIPGIYNYCDRWCERCSQTLHCLNFSVSEEEFSEPESRDIRNEAFWRKLSQILVEALESLKEAGKKWGIDPEAFESASDTESVRIKDEAAENHVVCRAAGAYGSMVEDWVKRREGLLFETASVGDGGVEIEEAFEVIRWYQYFIGAKVARAIRGRIEEEERGDELAGDSDGSAKIALVAMDRSIGAWAMILHCNSLCAEGALEIISFLDRLRQAVEETFPSARSFIRPGFDRIDLNG